MADKERILQALYDNKKQFYKKAKVRKENGKLILKSYSTDVAEIEGGKPYVKGAYSTTTLRHIKEFLKQEGFKAENKQQILKDYGKKQELKRKIKSKQKVPNPMKTVGMVAMMGDIFGQSQKEKNDWKKRMLNAGLGNQGLSFPDDFDNLSEKERKKRLDKSLKFLMES